MLNPFAPALSAKIRNRLLDRRKQLSETIELSPSNTNVRELLGEVDAALDRLTTSRYGICETCNEWIEVPQLLVDPLRRHCIWHLTAEERDKAFRDREFHIGLAPPARRWRMIEAVKAAWNVLHNGDGGSPDREMQAIKLLSLVETDQENRMKSTHSSVEIRPLENFGYKFPPVITSFIHSTPLVLRKPAARVPSTGHPARLL